MTEEAVDFDALARKEKRSAALIRRQLKPALDIVLDNEDGLARLLAISNEEWQDAVDAEAPDVE